MNQDAFHITIVTNTRGQTLQFTVSRARLKAAYALAVIAVLLGVSCLIDYAGLRPDRRAFQETFDEHARLQQNLAKVEARYSSRVAELDRVHSMVAKLKLITKIPYRDNPDAPPPAPVLSDGAAPGSDFDEAEHSPTLAREPATAVPATLPRLNFEQPELAKMHLPARIDHVNHMVVLQEQELVQLWESLTDREALLAATPTIKPTNGYYSSRFGYRIHPITHKPLLHAGIDIAAPYGSVVRAPAEGLVTYAAYERGYGYLVSIDHGFGVVTRFAHNSKIVVKEGQRVRRGEPISMVGSTGHSTGPHVHYEVRVQGFPVDPANYILQEN